ncbi:hypothetical protein GMMP15_260011 [Candidatus Magnetomoraceae bacterium gMMP-15]
MLKKETKGRNKKCAKITLDFKDYPHFYHKIHEVAQEEFRSPDQQIFFWLSGYLQAKEETKEEVI